MLFLLKTGNEFNKCCKAPSLYKTWKQSFDYKEKFEFIAKNSTEEMHVLFNMSDYLNRCCKAPSLN